MSFTIRIARSLLRRPLAAFLREDHGKARIWLPHLGQPEPRTTHPSPHRLSTCSKHRSLPNGDASVLAARVQKPSQRSSLQIRPETSAPLGIHHARYPAVSPDGHWLAYSELHNGNRNLRLRNLDNGQTRDLPTLPATPFSLPGPLIHRLSSTPASVAEASGSPLSLNSESLANQCP